MNEKWTPQFGDRVVHTLAIAHGEYGFGQVTELLTDGWVKVTWANDALRDTRRGGCRETIESVLVKVTS